MGESTEGRYDMIIFIYLFTALGHTIKCSKRVMEFGLVPYEG